MIGGEGSEFRQQPSMMLRDSLHQFSGEMGHEWSFYLIHCHNVCLIIKVLAKRFSPITTKLSQIDHGSWVYFVRLDHFQI